jgi:hypothetical protein
LIDFGVGEGIEKGWAETESVETGVTVARGGTIRSNVAGPSAGGVSFFALESIKKDPRPTTAASNPMPKSTLPGELEWDGATSVPRDPAVNDLVFKTSFGEIARRTGLFQHQACHALTRSRTPGTLRVLRLTPPAASRFDDGYL